MQHHPHHHQLRRRGLLLGPALAGLGAALGLLQGCGHVGLPRVITLSEAELSALVARAFPVQQRLLEVLDLQLSAPRLRLLPDANRLSVLLVVQAQERLRGGSGRGELRFDSALRYEPQDATVRLTQVRAQQLDFLPGVAETSATVDTLAALPGGVQRIGRLLAERLLEDLVVYRLNVERQTQLRQLGLQPGAVTVTSRGVEITLARPGG